MSEYQVILQHSGQILHVSDQLTLLTSLYQQQIPVEYQCLQGYCGICRTQLVRGEISYLSTPIAHRQPSEILLCSCVPQSSLVLAL